MRPIALMLGLAVAMASGSGATAPVQCGDPEDRDELVLDSAKVGKTIDVEKGQEVVLKLPAGMPRWWVLAGGKDALEEVVPRDRPAGELPFVEMNEPGNPPALGRPKWFMPRYRLRAAPGSKVEVTWVYSEFGKPPGRDQWKAYDPEDCKDDGKFALEKFEPGLSYRVTLKVAP